MSHNTKITVVLTYELQDCPPVENPHDLGHFADRLVLPFTDSFAEYISQEKNGVVKISLDSVTADINGQPVSLDKAGIDAELSSCNAHAKTKLDELMRDAPPEIQALLGEIKRLTESDIGKAAAEFLGKKIASQGENGDDKGQDNKGPQNRMGFMIGSNAISKKGH